MKRDFDVLVLGGGSGAKLAYDLSCEGYRTAIFEEGDLGGTCLNRGCIPSKMLIHTAELADEFARAPLFDLAAGSIRCHFRKLTERVDRSVSKWSREMAAGVKSNPHLEYIRKSARFLNAHTLEVGKEKLSAEKIFIATGGVPFIPPIKGLEETPYLTSTEALFLKRLPKELVVIGAGYIAAELGFFFAALGSKVTILARGDFLGREDRDVVKEFLKVFGKSVTVHMDCAVDEVLFEGGRFRIKAKRKIIGADQLLVAAGIRGATSSLGLENTRIGTDAKGFIEVDRYLRTKEKGVWALGDVIGGPFLRHKANFEANYLFDALFVSKKSKPIRYPPIPYAIFSSPQIAGVGLSEKELQEKKISYVTGGCALARTARGTAILPQAGFVKLLFDRESQKLLGAKLIGEEASTMCHIVSAFLHGKAKLRDLLEIIYIHPSLPEAIQSAAQSALEQFSSLR